MQDLLTHLVAERGPIRLVVDLAIALGTIAVTAVWTAEWIRDRRRRRAAVEAIVAEAPRRAA